jgi:hypothetical protein
MNSSEFLRLIYIITGKYFMSGEFIEASFSLKNQR